MLPLIDVLKSHPAYPLKANLGNKNMLHTALTELLGIETPIVSAAMGGITTGAFATQVYRAGGFGFVAPGFVAPETFTADLVSARTALSLPRDAPLPLGAGFLGWALDTRADVAACLDAALAQRVRAVWLAFGEDLGRWVRHVRAYDAARGDGHRTLVWVVVGSVEEARRAVGAWRADVLVVQGTEAGGHAHAQAPPLLTLLPLIQRALPTHPPLVAAGGLTSGAHVAAALMLGAAGAALGTRFLATPEAVYPAGHKAAVLRAETSVRSTAFDELAGLPWPAGVDGRALAGAEGVYADKAAGLGLEERKRRHREAVEAGDTSRVVWAGASVGLVDEISSVADVVKTIHVELVTELARAAAILGQ